MQLEAGRLGARDPRARQGGRAAQGSRPRVAPSRVRGRLGSLASRSPPSALLGVDRRGAPAPRRRAHPVQSAPSSSPVYLDRAALRARGDLRRRAGRPDPSASWAQAHDVPRHPPAVLAGGEQGLLSVAFHPQLRDERPLLRRLHGTERQHRHRRVPRARGAAARRARACSSNLPDPAPNHNGGQLVFGPDGYLWWGTGDGGGARRPVRQRPARRRPASRRCMRLDVDDRRARLADVGGGAAQPVALLVRPRERRALHRRRRPGRVGGDRLRPARRVAPELRLEPLRGQRRLRRRGAAAGLEADRAGPRLQPRRRLLDHRRLRLPRPGGPARSAATSSATTATAASGACASRTARRPTSAASLRRRRTSARSARTRPASSTCSRSAGRSTGSRAEPSGASTRYSRFGRPTRLPVAHRGGGDAGGARTTLAAFVARGVARVSARRDRRFVGASAESSSSGTAVRRRAALAGSGRWSRCRRAAARRTDASCSA